MESADDPPYPALLRDPVDDPADVGMRAPGDDQIAAGGGDCKRLLPYIGPERAGDGDTVRDLHPLPDDPGFCVLPDHPERLRGEGVVNEDLHRGVYAEDRANPSGMIPVVVGEDEVPDIRRVDAERPHVG